MKLLVYGRLYIVVEDYNGNVYLVGCEYGVDVTGGIIVFGVVMGDMSGYIFIFNVMECIVVNFISGVVDGDLFVGMILVIDIIVIV